MTHSWDYQVGALTNDGPPTRVVLHQFEPHLAASDSRGFIRYALPSFDGAELELIEPSIYNWQKNKRLSHFHLEAPGDRSANQRPNNISTLHFINEEDVAFLLAGSGASARLPFVLVKLR